ncbi:MAG TPA: O-methyltransferase [Terriglobales bacterium]|nr:O-methyltransferase [Terriglobales bacterium]
MSDEPTIVTEALARYLAARTQRDDAFLTALKRAARDAGFPPIWIAPEQASFLAIVLRLAGARSVIEIGTLAGYSAITMARALPAEGRVDTIEIDARRAAFAREWIARSDVAERIVVHHGAGAAILPRFAAGSADACLLDADKASYAAYLAECLRILRPRGLILADNAFGFGRVLDEQARDPDVLAVRAFNERMASTPGLRSVIVPLGDGLWLGMKE